MEAWRIVWRGFKLAPPDAFHLSQAGGVLFLDGLRRRLGDEAFFKLMAGFFDAHAGQPATGASFLEAAGVAFEVPDPGAGPAYLLEDIHSRLASAVLVYGTGREAGANRYAAERLQSRFLDQYESAVPDTTKTLKPPRTCWPQGRGLHRAARKPTPPWPPGPPASTWITPAPLFCWMAPRTPPNAMLFSSPGATHWMPATWFSLLPATTPCAPSRPPPKVCGRSRLKLSPSPTDR